MLSAPKCFWYNKSIFALRNKNCFDRKPKMTKKTVNPWLPAPPQEKWSNLLLHPRKNSVQKRLENKAFFLSFGV